jgi:photosystem II stability/assembly factor-like uncharacterized protein
MPALQKIIIRAPNNGPVFERTGPTQATLRCKAVALSSSNYVIVLSEGLLLASDATLRLWAAREILLSRATFAMIVRA